MDECSEETVTDKIWCRQAQNCSVLPHWCDSLSQTVFFRKLAFVVINKVLKFLNFVFSSESSELSRIETNNKMTIKRTQSRLHTSRMPQKTLSN